MQKPVVGAQGSLSRLLSMVVLSGVLAGCGLLGGDPPMMTVLPTERGWRVEEADRLYTDDAAPVDSMRQVITDSRSFTQFWDQATAGQDRPPPPPSIDFASHMVLMVSAGRRNAGDRMRVDSVGFRLVPDGNGTPREVMYAVVRLTVDCSPFPGNSYPLEVVRVQRADPAIDWLERRTEC